ncbi:hypothetical protein J2753_002373 [Halolamina salifodinae]|uniref:Uncharacterized protein n=2 Tax=Halolamina salifodinae TaxID=1202767 RepID=A0A8T4H0G7_9EURY|nr:hypothetical protein [Halolamina salifodinae]
MHSMFEQFSSGYYLGVLYVEPGEERAALNVDDHEAVNRQLYADSEGIERLDSPLVMKLDGIHFPVRGDEGVPSGTLTVPASLADGDLPARREVFLARPERAGQLLKYGGWRPADAA